MDLMLLSFRKNRDVGYYCDRATVRILHIRILSIVHSSGIEFLLRRRIHGLSP